MESKSRAIIICSRKAHRDLETCLKFF